MPLLREDIFMNDFEMRMILPYTFFCDAMQNLDIHIYM